MNDLQKDFAKCVKGYKEARKNLENCVKNALDRGLTKNEILLVAERYQSGMPFCTVIILNEILEYEKNKRQPPLDLVKERKVERGDV
jgi:hypothetical protein